VRHALRTQEVRYLRACFNPRRGVGKAQRYKLPLNSYTGDPGPIGSKRLPANTPNRSTPTISGLLLRHREQMIGKNLGDEITRNVDKATIGKFAKEHLTYGNAM